MRCRPTSAVARWDTTSTGQINRLGTLARSEPLHVYFPTEEHTGISLILNADFQMELDRRRLSQTLQAEPYNVWLLDQLAEFVSLLVVPQLLKQFNGLGVLDVLAPYGSESGLGEKLMHKILDLLREQQLVPCRDTAMRIPSAARLLPATVPDPITLHKWIDAQPTAVIPAAELSRPIRELLADRLKVPEISVESILKTLQPPVDADVEDFYTFLVDWSTTAPRPFVAYLCFAQCVSLPGGKWVRPNEGAAFLPPQRGETEFPPHLELPIAKLPMIEGLNRLLEDAGVQPLTWRALVAEFLMPRLSDPDRADDDRQSALRALRTYYDRVRRVNAGDQDIRERVSSTLLPARKDSVGESGLRRAGDLYFGEDWLPEAGLEKIYGAFNEYDFLAMIPGETRDSDLEFFTWLGVSDCPRVVKVSPIAPEHAGWRMSTDYRIASECLSGAHPYSQTLESAPSLDRLGEILKSESWDRLSALWKLLAQHWATYRGCLLQAIWRCVTSAHHPQQRKRAFPSPAMFLLRHEKWVPAERGGEQCLTSPDLVWRSTQAVPRQVIDHFLVPASGLTRPGSDFATDLGMLDNACLSTPDLVQVLLDFERDGAKGKLVPDGLVASGLWILRRIEDMADAMQLTPGSVPLISRKDGAYVFDRHPFLVKDPVFQDVWGDAAAIYAGDRNLDRVLNALDIRVLDDEVCVEPICGERQSDIERRVDNCLREAAPALIALAVTAVPSRRLELARRLNDLKVVCSSEIVLKYTLEGFKPRIDETSSVFVDAAGIVYVQTVDSNPDWPSLALRLAAYLDVESGDGFVIVLTSNQDVREDFLRARHISSDDLLAASKALQVRVPGELGQEDRYVVVDQADDAFQEVDETDPDTAAVIDQNSEVTHSVEPIVVGPGPHSSGNRAPGPGTGPPTQPAARPHIDSAGAAWGSETACQGGLAAKRPEVRDSRYFSYVVAQGSDDARIAERMDSEAMRIGNYGVQQVVAY